jgi:hypothetical protein
MSESYDCFVCGKDHPVYSKYQYPYGCPNVGRTSPLPVAATPTSPELSVEDQLRVAEIEALSNKASRKRQFEISRAKTKLLVGALVEEQRQQDLLAMKADLVDHHAAEADKVRVAKIWGRQADRLPRHAPTAVKVRGEDQPHGTRIEFKGEAADA